jgi:hypothetical protein
MWKVIVISRTAPLSAIHFQQADRSARTRRHSTDFSALRIITPEGPVPVFDPSTTCRSGRHHPTFRITLAEKNAPRQTTPGTGANRTNHSHETKAGTNETPPSQKTLFLRTHLESNGFSSKFAP